MYIHVHVHVYMYIMYMHEYHYIIMCMYIATHNMCSYACTCIYTCANMSLSLSLSLSLSSLSVQLVVQSVDDNTLEQLNSFSPPSSHPHTHTPPHPLMWDDMGLGMEGGGRGLATGPTPFSTKKDMYSGKGGTQVYMYIVRACMHAHHMYSVCTCIYIVHVYACLQNYYFLCQIVSSLPPPPPPSLTHSTQRRMVHRNIRSTWSLLEAVRRWKNLNSIPRLSLSTISTAIFPACDCTYPASAS